jgi:hypothetical protein
MEPQNFDHRGVCTASDFFSLMNGAIVTTTSDNLAALLSLLSLRVFMLEYTGLFEMIVGGLTTCHTQYT